MNRAARALALAVLALSIAACGPSNAEVKQANGSVYQAEFAEVWNAIASTVKEQYPRVVIEDAIHGRLLTDWHVVERYDSDDPTIPSGVQEGKFFRLKIHIRPGGPPWRVVVDGEAALYKPGDAMLHPYRHGAADEPTWVNPRLDKIRVGIYQKLKAKAIPDERPVETEEGPVDTGPWAGLPGDAPTVIAQIHAAARKKDTAALRGFMTDDFVWSPGGEPGVEAAVSFWSADPMVLAALVKTLDAGCVERETGTLIVCPARGGGPGQWRAELRGQAGAWRFAAFFREE